MHNNIKTPDVLKWYQLKNLTKVTKKRVPFHNHISDLFLSSQKMGTVGDRANYVNQNPPSPAGGEAGFDKWKQVIQMLRSG